MYANDVNLESNEDGYTLLAKAIISQAAEEYAELFPVNISSQLEFTKVDSREYAPKRRSILRKLCTGPLRSILDYELCYDAFEKRRRQVMREQGVEWN